MSGVVSKSEMVLTLGMRVWKLVMAPLTTKKRRQAPQLCQLDWFLSVGLSLESMIRLLRSEL
jgi:hypothetical protein